MNAEIPHLPETAAEYLSSGQSAVGSGRLGQRRGAMRGFTLAVCGIVVLAALAEASLETDIKDELEKLFKKDKKDKKMDEEEDDDDYGGGYGGYGYMPSKYELAVEESHSLNYPKCVFIEFSIMYIQLFCASSR